MNAKGVSYLCIFFENPDCSIVASAVCDFIADYCCRHSAPVKANLFSIRGADGADEILEKMPPNWLLGKIRYAKMAGKQFHFRWNPSGYDGVMLRVTVCFNVNFVAKISCDRVLNANTPLLIRNTESLFEEYAASFRGYCAKTSGGYAGETLMIYLLLKLDGLGLVCRSSGITIGQSESLIYCLENLFKCLVGEQRLKSGVYSRKDVAIIRKDFDLQLIKSEHMKSIGMILSKYKWGIQDWLNVQ